jgi:hypothetical protein
MPVVDGIFIPRSPLTPAELHVDFPEIDRHIVESRARVERAAQPHLNRITLAIASGVAPYLPIVVEPLAQALEQSLARTAHFGADHAAREIQTGRGDRALAAAPPTTTQVPPDPGGFSDLALAGLSGVLEVIRHRAAQAARLVGQVALAAFQSQADETDGLMFAKRDAGRSLHNQVLALVGEALNMGRAAGAITLPQPPEYALRSEQLDANTCAPCFELHGTITRVASPEFFEILPPVGCLGGGRCRGIMVFADGPHEVRQPEQLAA